MTVHLLDIHPSHLSSLTLLFIYWACFWRKEVRRSRRDKVMGPFLSRWDSDKNWCVEVHRSYLLGPRRIFAIACSPWLCTEPVKRCQKHLYSVVHTCTCTDAQDTCLVHATLIAKKCTNTRANTPVRRCSNFFAMPRRETIGNYLRILKRCSHW